MLKPADATKLIPVVCDDLQRLGARHNGGYVLSLGAVRRARYLFSFGLSPDFSFERAFRRSNPTAFIHCYDHTIDAPRLVFHSLRNLWTAPVEPSRLPGALRLLAYNSFFRGRVQHHRTRIWYNHDADSVTMQDVFALLGARGEAVVKMNIGGSEYRVLDDLAELASRIETMVIVFHDIDMMGQQFDAAVDRLKRDFHIVHIHPNNTGGLSPAGLPNVLEISFLNRRLFASPPPPSERSYPVPGLDAKNDPALPDLRLQFDGQNFANGPFTFPD